MTFTRLAAAVAALCLAGLMGGVAQATPIAIASGELNADTTGLVEVPTVGNLSVTVDGVFADPPNVVTTDTGGFTTIPAGASASAQSFAGFAAGLAGEINGQGFEADGTFDIPLTFAGFDGAPAPEVSTTVMSSSETAVARLVALAGVITPDAVDGVLDALDLALDDLFTNIDPNDDVAFFNGLSDLLDDFIDDLLTSSVVFMSCELNAAGGSGVVDPVDDCGFTSIGPASFQQGSPLTVFTGVVAFAQTNRVPAPGMVVLLGVGLVGLGVMRRRLA